MIENIQQEQKNELGDENKPAAVKKGLGVIFVFFGILLVVYLFFSLNGSNKQEENAMKEEQIFIEKKNFVERETSLNNPFVATSVPAGNSSYGSQNPFGNAEEVAKQQRQGGVPKGLSSAAVPTSGKTASNDNGGGSAPAVSSAVAASAARANELRQMAQNMQSQLTNLQTAALGGGSSGGDSRDVGVVENTAVAVIAKKSSLDPNLALDKGTFISCVLKTAIISTIAGNIACIITDDVYSAAGTVLLIEKGSVVQGSFRSGELKPGMNRLFVIWEEIKTPKRVVIDVNSPATDALGGSGVDGWVNNHYMQRFGASILLSMIDDAFSAAVNNKDGRDYTMNTRENTVDMANTALENTINIPPTLYKNQGDIVGIYVNKDVDFSKVYRLQRVLK